MTSSKTEKNQHQAPHASYTDDSSTTDGPLYAEVVHSQSSTVRQSTLCRAVPDVCAYNVVEATITYNLLLQKPKVTPYTEQ